MEKKQIVSGEAIINDQNITLLPFTFDDFGSMGPLATSYFFDGNKVPSITDKNKLSKFPDSILKAYKRGREHLKTKKYSLFKSAKKWCELTNKDRWFGSTYQLTSPSNWGKYYLAMNLNTSIIQHIKNHSPSLTNLSMSKPKKKYKILGRQAIAHQGIEPNHRKPKNNKNTNRKPKQHTAGVDPQVNKPYESFLSSLNNSYQTRDEDTM